MGDYRGVNGGKVHTTVNKNKIRYIILPIHITYIIHQNKLIYILFVFYIFKPYGSEIDNNIECMGHH